MDSTKARKLKEGFLVKKVGKLPVNLKTCKWFNIENY